MIRNKLGVSFVHDSHVEFFVVNNYLPTDAWNEFEKFYGRVGTVTVKDDEWYYGEVAWFRYSFMKIKKTDVNIVSFNPSAVFQNSIKVFNGRKVVEVKTTEIAEHYVYGYMLVHVIPRKIIVDWATVEAVDVCRYGHGTIHCNLEPAMFMKLKVNFYAIVDLWFGEAWYNCNAVVYLVRGIPFYSMPTIATSDIENMLIHIIPPYITHHLFAHIARWIIHDIVKGFKKIGKTKIIIKIGKVDKYIETEVTVYRGRNRKYFVGLAHIISYIYHKRKEKNTESSS